MKQVQNTRYIVLIRIASRVDLAMSVCPYERWDLRNYMSRMPRPL